MKSIVVLQFDMRSSPECREGSSDRYRACLEMAKWADDQRITVVGFSEHHNTTDGFLSSPLMMAMAAAATTRRVAINVSALLLPLHDPVRIAEDIAVLDLVSQGRFMTTLGLGYRQVEYEVMGVDWHRRGAIFDEKIATVLRAWEGLPFTYRGAQLQLDPVPLRAARQLICIGGNSPAAARRAARFGLMFAPPIDDPALREAYDDECRKLGFAEGYVIFPNEPSLTLIADDPDRSWAELGQYLLYDAMAYGAWRHPTRRAYAESGATTVGELRAEGKYCILTPEQAIEKTQAKGALNMAPLCGGIPIAAAWESLQLYAGKVAPALG